LALLLLRRNYHVGWLTSLTEIFADGSALRRFFAINRDIFLRTTCLVAVTLWFTRTGSTQGAEILAANTLLMQMFTLFSYFMDGFAYSGEALCGRYYGAGDSRRLAQCVGRLMAIGAMVAAVFTLAGLLLGRHAAEFLTDDTTVIDTAMRYYYPALGVAACGFTAFIFDGVCIGLTRTRDMLGSMVAASAMFFAAWLTLVPRYGNYGLWAAFLLYLTARSVYMATRYAWRR
jgi:MATE family multidrug resistance protein